MKNDSLLEWLEKEEKIAWKEWIKIQARTPDGYRWLAIYMTFKKVITQCTQTSNK